MKMFRVILQLVLLHSISILLFAEDNKAYNYEPTVVILTGTILREVFPGRPNYESIESGDEEEIYWILYLERKIDVDGKDDVNIEEKSIERVQLKLSSDQYKEYQKYVKKKVRVYGSLFHGTTGHHKTEILIDVKKIEDF